jgi:excisionase family DNA binding protein
MTPFNGVMWHEQADLAALEVGLSAPQAARALGVSLGTIYRWSDLGHLESYRSASGQRRFSQERIDGFISLLGRQHVDPLIDRRTG